MVSKTDRKMERTRRHKRVRTKVSGTAEKAAYVRRNTSRLTERSI